MSQPFHTTYHTWHLHGDWSVSGTGLTPEPCAEDGRSGYPTVVNVKVPYMRRVVKVETSNKQLPTNHGLPQVVNEVKNLKDNAICKTVYTIYLLEID